MGISVTWYDEKQTILLYVLEVDAAMKDVIATIDAGNKMIDTVDHQVNVLVDTRSARMAMDVQSMREITRHPSHTHPRIGNFYIVGSRNIFKTVLDIYRRLFPQAMKRYVITTSMEEALQLIQQAHPDQATTV